MSKADESKKKIFEAAIAIAGRDGFGAMSLDKVAAEAGISKGGLVYHFKTKDELVQETFKHFAEVGQTMLLHRIALDPTPKMRWARAIVSCMFPSEQELEKSQQALDPDIIFKFMLSMLNVAADGLGDVTPLVERGERIREMLLEEDSKSLDQLMVWLAIDGLMVWQLLKMIEPGDPLFNQIGDALRDRVGLPERTKDHPIPQ